MILTCPACTMRYLVAEGAVGPEGRRVRCAHCGHQWFQEPETGLDEELFGAEPEIDIVSTSGVDEDDMPFEDGALTDDVENDDFQSILQKELEEAPIPEGVKPIHIHEDITLPGASADTKRVPTARLGGYAAAAIVWAIVFGGFILMQPQLSRAWPPSNLIYDLVGLTPVPPGDGLSLDNLHAEMGDGKIVLTGDIINLRDEEVKVPAVVASVVDVNDKEIDRTLIAPPVARLKAEGRVSFNAAYPKIPDGAANVNYAFSYVKAKPTEAQKAEEGEPPAEPGTPPTEIKPDAPHDEAPQHPAPHH